MTVAIEEVLFVVLRLCKKMALAHLLVFAPERSVYHSTYIYIYKHMLTVVTQLQICHFERVEMSDDSEDMLGSIEKLMK